MIICDDCEKKHSHPLIKFNNDLISNKEQLFKLITVASNKNDLGILDKIKNKFNNSDLKEKVESLFKKTNLRGILRFDGEEIPKIINVHPNSNFKLRLELFNDSIKNELPKGIKIFPLNNRDLEITPFITDVSLVPKQLYKLELNCKTPNKNDIYDVKFIIFHKTEAIQCQPLILKFKVGIDEEERLNEFFGQFPNIVKLNKEKKKIIFDIINDELSNKLPNEIMIILEKFNWKVEFALDELMG